VRLTRVSVAGYRSFQHKQTIELGDGLNCVVGPNNSGKSNLIGAIGLALDPAREVSQTRDLFTFDGTERSREGLRQITLELEFEADEAEAGSVVAGGDGLLLKRAEAYELAARRRAREGEAPPKRGERALAAQGRIILVTNIRFRKGEVTRHDFLQVSGLSGRTPTSRNSPLPGPESREHINLFKALRDNVRFLDVRSGQSLESLLRGPLKEVLRGVIHDNMEQHLKEAEASREDYSDRLQLTLLRPLGEQVVGMVSEFFPEMTRALLIPSIPSIVETLSSLGIDIQDSMTSGLAQKGTGVRSVVLVAILAYLADQARSSLVLAVEEPESFLHPAAQEQLGESLQRLAERPGVSLVVTTHSPFLVPRTEKGRLIGVAKGRGGGTRLDDSDRDHSESLFRDAGYARLIERAMSVPPGRRFVLITEGTTDWAYARIAADKADRRDLLEGFHHISAGGAIQVPAVVALTTEATDRPVIVLVDSDEMGLWAAKVVEKFTPNPRRKLIKVGGAPVKGPQPVDAESLWPAGLNERRMADLSGLPMEQVKEESPRWYREHATAEDAGTWVRTLEWIRRTALDLEVSLPG
jgi:putative ATP-dependent endonuclease of the OLD family